MLETPKRIDKRGKMNVSFRNTLVGFTILCASYISFSMFTYYVEVSLVKLVICLLCWVKVKVLTLQKPLISCCALIFMFHSVRREIFYTNSKQESWD